MNTGPAPWPLGDDQAARITAAGLPALDREILTVHYHAHLDVFVDGRAIRVPTDIGIDRRAKVISPLHTHDDRGIVHVESAVDKPFTLGQLFTEWGVRLDGTCVGGYCAPATPVAVYVNGQQHGDPRTIAFASAQEVAVVIGTPPATVPSTVPQGVR